MKKQGYLLMAVCTGLMLAVQAQAGSYFGTINTPFYPGDGISNDNFTITDDNGIQVALKAHRRFLGDLPNDGVDTYYAVIGNSPTSGAAGAPLDPGTATWNFDWHVNLAMAGRSLADTQVNLSMTFTPSGSMTPVPFWNLDFNAGAAALNIDPSTVTLAQGSENPGFNWLTQPPINGPTFDPFATGVYTLTLSATDTAGPGWTTTAVAHVNVVPLPVAVFAGLPLLAGLAGARLMRRKQED